MKDLHTYQVFCLLHTPIWGFLSGLIMPPHPLPAAPPHTGTWCIRNSLGLGASHVYKTFCCFFRKVSRFAEMQTSLDMVAALPKLQRRKKEVACSFHAWLGAHARNHCGSWCHWKQAWRRVVG